MVYVCRGCCRAASGTLGILIPPSIMDARCETANLLEQMTYEVIALQRNVATCQ